MDQQRSDAYSDVPFYFDVDLDPDPTIKVVQANNGRPVSNNIYVIYNEFDLTTNGKLEKKLWTIQSPKCKQPLSVLEKVGFL